MPPGSNKRSNLSLVMPFAALALVFGVLIWGKYKTSRVMEPAPPPRQSAGKHTAVLFFVEQGTRLAREGREMPPCAETEACVKGVLDELFYGPVGELDEALPEGVALNGVRISGDTAIIDVSREFSEELVSGSSAEMMAVYSIVDTVCINFPQIAQVKLNVQGNEQVVLQHLDLSDPLTPDFSLERSPEPLPVEPAAGVPAFNTRKGPK